jgi:hypothetical protein
MVPPLLRNTKNGKELQTVKTIIFIIVKVIILIIIKQEKLCFKFTECFRVTRKIVF